MMPLGHPGRSRTHRTPVEAARRSARPAESAALMSSSIGNTPRDAATSNSRSPGAAKSKSNSATASPLSNTTFSRQTSLWHITSPPLDRPSPCPRWLPRGRDRSMRHATVGGGERSSPRCIRARPTRVRRRCDLTGDEASRSRRPNRSSPVRTCRRNRLGGAWSGTGGRLRVRVRRTQHVVPDPDNGTGVGNTAVQHLFVSDDSQSRGRSGDSD